MKLSPVRFCIGFVCFFGCISQSICYAASRDIVPRDLKIIARYGGGYSPANPWRLTITADGHVLQETWLRDDTCKTRNLSIDQANLRRILAAVRKADFYSMKREYAYDISDSVNLVLSVTMDGKSHYVNVYAPRLLRENADVRRFITLWRTILAPFPIPVIEKRPG
jgi:hypothetical protein